MHAMNIILQLELHMLQELDMYSYKGRQLQAARHANHDASFYMTWSLSKPNRQ